MPSFLDQIKHRKIVQWTLAYLAGSWALLQVLDLVVERFSWPGAIVRIAMVVIAAGLLVTIILAWYHGERGRQRVGGVELILLAGVLALSGVVVPFVAADRTAANPVVEKNATQRAVAVLPFDNLSADAENAFLGDAITEEILTSLAKVGGLRVTSRTSVMRYKQTDKSMRQIGEELGASHILEGSVQRAGDRIRITAQLIDAKTDQHLWAEKYDRELKDVFALQAEIAQNITSALRVYLPADEKERIAAVRTENAEAYNLYLKAREFRRATVSSPQARRENRTRAITVLRRALQLDPNFASAYAELAFAYRLLGAAGRDSAFKYAHRAIELAPDLPDGYAALGHLYKTPSGRFTEASEQLRKAIALDPNNANALIAMEDIKSATGQIDQALLLAKRVVELEPTEGARYARVAQNYWLLGMDREAEMWHRKRLQIEPKSVGPRVGLFLVYLARREFSKARAQLDTMRAEAPDELPTIRLTTAAYALHTGDYVAAKDAFEAFFGNVKTVQWDLVDLAFVYKQLGQREKADTLLRRIEQHATNKQRGGDEAYGPPNYRLRTAAVRGDNQQAVAAMRELLKVDRGNRYRSIVTDPILADVRKDPEFTRMLARMKANVDSMRAIVMKLDK